MWLWLCSDIPCISVLLSSWPKHRKAHVDNSAHTAVTCCPVTISLIHALCLSWFLVLFWPLAACLTGSWRGGGVDLEVEDSWVGIGAFTNRGRWQDVRISYRDFASCFAVPAGRRGQQPALLSQPTLRTQEESGSLFYHRGILKKQLRKDHSSAGGTQTPEVYLSYFHLLR